MTTPALVRDEIFAFIQAMPRGKVIAAGTLCEAFGMNARANAKGLWSMIRRAREDDPSMRWWRVQPADGRRHYGGPLNTPSPTMDGLRSDGVGFREVPDGYVIDMRRFGMTVEEAQVLRSSL